ncbi:MAG: hypothetical protein IKF14_18410 [Atopobiaceae bacterium]|nr:hypothetical protein [Atopobiaceae bacterium]MBR3161063.1 hypothetical protein [Atopobiaceae bacterium]
MSCKSAIHTVNTNADVAANGQIPFGSIVRRFGQDVDLQGSDIVCCGRGYYDCDCSVTLAPVAAGDVGIQLYADGNPIPGAFAQGTGTAGDPLNLCVTALVRQRCCGATSVSLRLVTPTGITTGATVANASMVIEKL